MLLPPLPRPVLFSSPFSSPPFLPVFYRGSPAATASSVSRSRSVCRKIGDADGARRTARQRRARRCAAVERESEFEIDRDKAREALEKLDQQLKALSEKETPPPKRLAKSSSSPSYLDMDPNRQQMMGMRAEEPEISGSYVAYAAVALLIVTVINNIIFNVLIKPSVDGEEPVPTVAIKSLTPGNITVKQAPSLEQQ